MPKTKVEVYDKDQLIYPFIESDHVTFSNGMKITEMLDQSISMPKVTHEDSSFKVGVGDQDVSSAIVDSSVADMTIKGQTYQNILPEPSLRNKMQGKSMQRLNEGYGSIETVDGVSKSAILKGNTLINMAKQQEAEIIFNKRYQMHTVINNVQPGGLIHGEHIYMSMEVNIHELNIETSSFKCLSYRDSGGYGLQVKSFDEIKNMPKNTWVRISTIRQVKEAESLNNYSLGFGLHGEHPTVSGEQIARVSFRNPIWINLTKIYGNGNEPMLTECDNIPYFEGMQSVKMPVLTTTGKNLFDGKIENGEIDSYGNNGEYAKDRHRSVNYISVKPNTQYIFSTNIGETACNWIWYDKDKKFIQRLYSITTTSPSNAYYLRYLSGIPETTDITTLKVQIEEGSTETPYEPYKSNILSTPEDLELRGIGNVKDTLNLMTGELTQRIGEIVLDGSENWKTDINGAGVKRYFLEGVGSDLSDNISNSSSLLCDKFKASSNIWTETNDSTQIIKSNGIYFIDSSVDSLDAFVNKLKTTNIKVQYSLIEKPVKTVDLSSSGNWEKVVLDGSENWRWDFNDNQYFQTYIPRGEGNKFNNSVPDMDGGSSFHDANLNHYTSFAVGNNYGFTVKIVKSEFPHDLSSSSGDVNLNVWKQYLSQNPITVWYQTATHQDSTQVKQPIFFKDGHIQLSSGADNSLIPTLDYQAKTSNSYVMDLMKTNTKYTMKAKSASGTFTIDGTQYNFNTNGTFTTPSTMNNKLMITNGTVTDLMFIEGDVTSKTIPYFKGIKSAFEDEDKIEVLSTGKNLFDKNTIPQMGVEYKDFTKAYATTIEPILKLKPNTLYQISGEVTQIPNRNSIFKFVDNNGVEIQGTYVSMNNTNGNEPKTIVIKNKFTTGNNGEIYFNTFPAYTQEDLDKLKDILNSSKIQIEESSTQTSYEPYKSNTTKIPLLSPLRSLPNGVCDELIIDRLNHKAKLVQRIAYETYVGEELWGCYNENVNKKVEGYFVSSKGVVDVSANTNLFSQPFRPNDASIHMRNEEGVGTSSTGSSVRICINRDKLYPLGYFATGGNKVGFFKQWLSKNPTTVLYELKTPIITEIDLEGYPYAYKDGHIFLNSDIAPTTQITYSINQTQQIESANENLQRHEKEISHLQKLIAQYIQVEYVSTLLSLKL